jgi:hypothetical protein
MTATHEFVVPKSMPMTIDMSALDEKKGKKGFG